MIDDGDDDAGDGEPLRVPLAHPPCVVVQWNDGMRIRDGAWVGGDGRWVEDSYSMHDGLACLHTTRKSFGLYYYNLSRWRFPCFTPQFQV